LANAKDDGIYELSKKLLDDEIQIIMNEHKVNKIANYQKVDYITEFPQLDKCIIMDEEIVGNLPFKTLKK
jgi:hypothetical protein